MELTNQVVFCKGKEGEIWMAIFVIVVFVRETMFC
jgi:hypothetical protein